MDLVLGLSVTSTAVRWVLVEGVTGDGDAVDRGALDIVDGVEFDADALLTVLLDANEAVIENGVHAVGVTWTPAGEPIAGPIVEALQERGVQNAISVSELEAAEALASGIADLGGFDNVAVCVFEPGYTMVAVVNADGVTAEPQNLPDDVELAASVIALDLNDRQLDAIFVVGSADLDPVVSSMDTVAAAPVISAAEADMAMSRGAAVASAMAVNALAGDPTMMMRLRGMSKTSMLASVLVAAGVTLVISLSVALGLQAISDSPSETQNASATGEQIKEMTAPSKARAAPKLEQHPAAKPVPAARPSAPEPAAPVPAAPPVAQTMVAVPPAPAAVPDADVPAYVPPAPAYVPPAPAYTPPPAYAPPQPQVPAVQPEPRLRDKIIERIPIINRFHDPQPMYPPG
ncbi:MAG: hypothetical protein QOJ24_2439 [Mycobacterium sp.]|jgi:hypothetical protein|nr:hypothetical protein [Mycobacterium sp.]